MSTLAGLWTRRAPSSPPPCPACLHVRYVLGIQQLCSCCECVRSAQATAIHVRPATLDEPAAAQPRAQRLRCRQRILVLTDAQAASVHLMGRAQSTAKQC